MAINYSRLGTRLGRWIAAANEANTYRGTTLQARAATIAAEYTTVNPSLVTDLYNQRDAAAGSFQSYLAYLSDRVAATIVAEVQNDRPLANPSISTALAELVRQMIADAQAFAVSTTAITGPSPVGGVTSTTQFAVTTKDGTGQAVDTAVPDVYLIRVTADAARGGTRFAETLSLTGKPADPGPNDWTYPSGSGISTTVTIRDPALAQGLVQDPAFLNWTVANTPDSWSPVASSGAVPGTTVFRVADDPRGLTAPALRFLATGAATYKVRQTVTVRPNTVYAVHFKYKPVAGTTSGTFCTVQLVNANTGSVLADAQGTNNALTGATHAVTAPGAGWANGYQTFFITPTNLPDNVALEIAFTGAAAAAEGYVSHVNLVEASPLYAGGPTFVAWSGTAPSIYLDSWTLTVGSPTNPVSSYVIRWLDRFLGLKSLGIRLPTKPVGSGATILDSVIA